MSKTEEYNCDNCGEDFCECPPPILETKEVPVTLNIKIAFHTNGNSTWSIHTSLEKAVLAWSFGSSRSGAHHWDSETCHIYHDKEKNKYHLLYL